ncbi:MAG: hypothetical protein IIY49_03330 [Eubacterium sp.]|nr:hypothetical protein [Eubacterium sp.]
MTPTFDNKLIKEKYGVNAFVLKVIAMAAMLIDHIGAAILEYHPAVMYNSKQSLILMDYLLRGIGRLAFPIFAFLIVEGFFKTKNVLKYSLRLFIFALISEVPFDMAVFNKVVDIKHQNVFFTLLLGLISIMMADRIRPLFKQKKVAKPVETLVCYLIALFYGFVALLLNTDYSVFGVLIIFTFYYFNDKKSKCYFINFIFILCFGMLELFAVPDVILFSLYNGKHGKALDKKQVRIGFYAFYPMSFLILWALRRYVFKY